MWTRRRSTRTPFRSCVMNFAFIRRWIFVFVAATTQMKKIVEFVSMHFKSNLVSVGSLKRSMSGSFFFHREFSTNFDGDRSVSVSFWSLFTGRKTLSFEFDEILIGKVELCTTGLSSTSKRVRVIPQQKRNRKVFRRSSLRTTNQLGQETLDHRDHRLVLESYRKPSYFQARVRAADRVSVKYLRRCLTNVLFYCYSMNLLAWEDHRFCNWEKTEILSLFDGTF